VLAVKAGKLIDGTSESLQDRVVFVEGETIVKVGKG